MRLIDADELKIKLADELSDALGETDFTDGLQHGLKLAISLAEETPLADAKPIIRCKDCKFWGTEQDGYCAAIDDPYMLETYADDFCSWGEKK